MAGVLAFILLLVFTLPERVRPFAPGELDLLLAARSAARGVVLPLWAGAVHPEATGSWLAALALALPLKLGVPDVVALRAAGAAHLALAVGATAGITARLAGRQAGWMAAALLLAAPGFVGAHSRYMGTTVEVAAAEAALVWGLLGLGAGRRGAAIWGLGLGVSIAFSPHAALVALLGIWVLRRRLQALLVAGVAAAAAWAPFLILRDPLGPERPALAVLARGPGEVWSMLDAADVVTLLKHAPFALHPQPGGLSLPFAGAMGLAVLACIGLGVHAFRGRQTSGLVVAWAGLAAMPLMLADDLMGYPAGYRYFVNLMPPLAIVGALALPKDRRGVATATVLLLLGLVSLPAHRSAELDRPAAAFYAGQHRISLPWRRPLHTHFSWLWPTLRPEEQAPFAQGYGLHLAREHGPMQPHLEALVSEGVATGRDAELAAAGTRPSTWLGAATLVARGGARRGFQRGFGLGLGEDGRLDARELSLLKAAPDSDAVWFGVYAAVAERAHWGVAERLVIDGGRAAIMGFEPSPEAVVQGLAECLDGAPTPPADLLPLDTPPHVRDAVVSTELPMARRAFGLRHPFKYAEVGLGGGAAKKRAR
jgi:hypothetical protein